MEQITPSGYVSREVEDQLAAYSSLVRREAVHQNLVSARTLLDFAERHILDSRQLAPFLGPGRLVDIGSGAGLPGIVLAIVTDIPVTLVEPRRKRAEFLARVVDVLGLAERVEVVVKRIEAVSAPEVRTITARAVARLDLLFEKAHHLAAAETRWILPKGRSAAAELAQARRSWHGDFRLMPSQTDPDAAIVIAEGVRRRA